MAMSTGTPCAACKCLRRKCAADCAFSPYFPPEEPQKFANVHKLFGASNVSKLISELPLCARDDAVSSLAYEAEARLKDPVYGCAGAIAILQCRVAQLQAELVAARSELSRLKRDGGSNDAILLHCKHPSDTFLPPYSHPFQKSSPHDIYPSSASKITSNISINPAPSAMPFLCSPNPEECTPCLPAYDPASSSAFHSLTHIPQSTFLANHAEASSSSLSLSSTQSSSNSLHPPPSSAYIFSDRSSAAGGGDYPSGGAHRSRRDRGMFRGDGGGRRSSEMQTIPTHMGLPLPHLDAETNVHMDSSSSSDTIITTKCDYNRTSSSSSFNAAEEVKLEHRDCQ